MIVELLSGRWSGDVLPEAVCEHLMAEHYGWTLEYIRALNASDFKKHIVALQMRELVEAKKIF